jgi:4-diphosphocytidyl-2-C-methyl-D-erythritol kinase
MAFDSTDTNFPVRVFSPAKLNLYLRVLNKRADGYHNIITRMQKIDLMDVLEFQEKGNRVVLRCPGFPQLENQENIIHKAVKNLREETGFDRGLEITLHKVIPTAAGLGGGSSNAATTLMTLNEMFTLNLSRERLMAIGARLGADVPFFIYGDRAWASGIGDRLEEAAKLPPLWCALVNPGVEVSTREVYEGLNLGLTNHTINYSILRYSAIMETEMDLHNDLEKVSFRLFPELKAIKERMLEAGALGALMSGSGPTIYGFFDHESTARQAVSIFGENQNWFVRVVRPL